MPSIPDNSPFWFTFAIFAFMGLMVFLQTRNTSKVGSADATEKIGGAYNELLENMRKQIAVLRAEAIEQKKEFDAEILKLKEGMDYLNKELGKYRNWSGRLVKQLLENGITPVLPPDTGELNPK